jgi:hypothetical protein
MLRCGTSFESGQADAVNIAAFTKATPRGRAGVRRFFLSDGADPADIPAGADYSEFAEGAVVMPKAKDECTRRE